MFIDHSTTVELINQISLTFFNTDKLNLKLIRVSQFLFALFIRIKIKSKKFHLMFDALSRFVTQSNEFSSIKSAILKDLYNVEIFFAEGRRTKKMTISDAISYKISDVMDFYFEERTYLLKMNDEFKKKLQKIYESNFQ